MKKKTPLPTRLGIIAGAGSLPLVVASEAEKMGISVVAVGLEGFVGAEMKPLCRKYDSVSPGRLETCIRILKDFGAEQVALCGQIDHSQVFQIKEIDDLMRSILAETDKRAEPLLGRIAAAIESSGLPVADLRLFLGGHLAGEGLLNSFSPEENLLWELEFAWPLAEKASELNIGQALLVRSGIVVAVEGLEGTDEMIRRGGELAGPGAIVVKLPLRNKDPRFDIPVVGSKTISAAAKAGVGLLAIAAHGTIIVDPKKFIESADAAGIAVIAKEPSWGERE
jgi:DUF1009 family protein